MKKYILSLLFSSIGSMTIHAQDTIPHGQGKVTISIKKGTIECDLVNCSRTTFFVFSRRIKRAHAFPTTFTIPSF